MMAMIFFFSFIYISSFQGNENEMDIAVTLFISKYKLLGGLVFDFDFSESHKHLYNSSI